MASASSPRADRDSHEVEQDQRGGGAVAQEIDHRERARLRGVSAAAAGIARVLFFDFVALAALLVIAGLALYRRVT